jgi:hypothetical protein
VPNGRTAVKAIQDLKDDTTSAWRDRDTYEANHSHTRIDFWGEYNELNEILQHTLASSRVSLVSCPLLVSPPVIPEIHQNTVVQTVSEPATSRLFYCNMLTGYRNPTDRGRESGSGRKQYHW